MRLAGVRDIRLNPPSGTFDILPDKIVGKVIDSEGNPKRPLELRLVEMAPPAFARVSGILRETRTGARRDRGQATTFSIDFPSGGQGRAFLLGALAVQARSEKSDWGTLKLDGLTEMFLIKEHFQDGSQEIASVDFRRGGNLVDYGPVGWHGGEENYAWAEGTESELSFPAPAAQGVLECRFEMAAYLAPPARTEQRLAIWLNENMLFYHKAEDRLSQYHRFRIPPPMRPAGEDLILRFRHPDAIRPLDAEGRADRRLLSFAFKRLSLVQFDF